jgi:hypothetical protein
MANPIADGQRHQRRLTALVRRFWQKAPGDARVELPLPARRMELRTSEKESFPALGSARFPGIGRTERPGRQDGGAAR